MTIRSQLATLRMLCATSVVSIVLILSFSTTVPNAAEMATQSGWLVVIVNFAATTGIVVLVLTGLAWATLSVLLFPFAKRLLRLHPTGALVIDWFEWFRREAEASAHNPANQRGLSGDDFAAPLVGDFMHPGNGLRDNICILIQVVAFPIALVLVAVAQSIAVWLF